MASYNILNTSELIKQFNYFDEWQAYLFHLCASNQVERPSRCCHSHSCCYCYYCCFYDCCYRCWCSNSWNKNLFNLVDISLKDFSFHQSSVKVFFILVWLWKNLHHWHSWWCWQLWLQMWCSWSQIMNSHSQQNFLLQARQ